MDLLKTERGRHFDPAIVDLFIKHLDEFLVIKEFYKEQR